MTTARALAKVIVDEYSDSSMSLVLEVVRLVALEREQRAARHRRLTPPEQETPAKIVATVCAHFEITEREIRTRARRGYVLQPRAMIWFLLRNRLRRNYTDIGDMFDRDHTTIIQVLKKFEPDAGALEAITRRLDETKESARAAVGEAAE